MGPYMTKLSSVLLFVLTTLAPTAHAGWFDWFTPVSYTHLTLPTKA